MCAPYVLPLHVNPPHAPLYDAVYALPLLHQGLEFLRQLADLRLLALARLDLISCLFLGAGALRIIFLQGCG